MNPKGTTSYDEALGSIYELANSGKIAEGLEKIVDPATGRLRGVFRQDGNHSWYVVGNYYWKLGLFENAIRAFRRSLRAWEGDIQAMWALGNCYTEAKKPKRAEHFFRRALELEKFNPSIRFNLGNALFDQGRFDDAIVEYEAVAKTSKDLSEVALKNIHLAKQKREGRLLPKSSRHTAD